MVSRNEVNSKTCYTFPTLLIWNKFLFNWNWNFNSNLYFMLISDIKKEFAFKLHKFDVFRISNYKICSIFKASQN